MINFIKSLLGINVKDKTCSLGKLGEKYAAEYLRKQGYKIIHQSYETNIGEIDVIARKGNLLVFCEVKARSSLERGHPLEAVNLQKQRQITKVALQYLKIHRLHGVSIRFDAIGIIMNSKGEVQECKHVVGAFDGSLDLG